MTSYPPQQLITKQEIEKILNTYTENKKLSVKNILYFQTAFIQKSCKTFGETNNEMLEFLGDSFFNAITVEYLYNRFDDTDEGFLTKLKTKLVSKTFLAYFAKQLNFDTFIMTSRKLTKINDRFLEDAFESFIGALIKDEDGDISKARFFIISLFENLIDFSELISSNNNYKEQLLHVYQKYKMLFPVYSLIEEDKKYFKVGVYVDEEKLNLIPKQFHKYIKKDGDRFILGTGIGEIKRDAEQECSKEILKWFKSF